MEEKMPKLHGETVLSEEWNIIWGRIFMMAIWIALNKSETRNLNNNNNINNNNNNSKSETNTACQEMDTLKVNFPVFNNSVLQKKFRI